MMIKFQVYYSSTNRAELERDILKSFYEKYREEYGYDSHAYDIDFDVRKAGAWRLDVTAYLIPKTNSFTFDFDA